MRDISRTRIARRGFGVLATALLALLGLGAIPAAAEPPESGLVGRWDVTVTIHITEPPEHAYLYCTLSAEHLVSCDSKPGQPPLHGQGVWNKTEGNTFAFWITHHAFLDANGVAAPRLLATTAHAGLYEFAPGALLGDTTGRSCRRIS